MKNAILKITVVLFAVLVFATVFFVSEKDGATQGAYPTAKLVSSETEGKIPLSKNGQTDFTIIYSSSDFLAKMQITQPSFPTC